MPWNRKTSRRDRKWWSRLLRRNYRAQKREAAIDAENEQADRARFKDIGISHLPIVDTINFTPIKYLGFGEDE